MSDRSKAPTQRGTPPPANPRDSMEIKTSIYEPSPSPAKAKAAESGPIQVFSMKTPGVDDPERDTPSRARPEVKLRAMSEVAPARHAQPRNLGNLAPPRDASEVRRRRVQDVVIWGCVAVMLACGIALAIWFLAR